MGSQKKMKDILKDVGMAEFIKIFAKHEVGPQEVLNLNDVDFWRLGVNSVGKRAMLRNRCKLHLEGKSPEPRSRRSSQQKTTQRLTVGWMHRVDGEYKLISLYKGGGRHQIDVCKSTNLSDLKKRVEAVFFSGGYSIFQKIHITKLETCLATFTGKRLPFVLQNGDPFTVEGYVKQVGTNPVRIYLQTKPAPVVIKPRTKPEEYNQTIDYLISVALVLFFLLGIWIFSLFSGKS